MSSFRQPTQHEAERIAYIVGRVHCDLKSQTFDWGEHKAEAFDLCRAISGYRPNKTCFSCWVRVLNILREGINLDPIDHPAPKELADKRLDICRVCPAYHATSASCGRLILDALYPEPVNIDGRMVNPCGCSLHLKVHFKRAKCPAGKW